MIKQKLMKFYEGSFEHLEGLWFYIFFSLATASVWTIIFLTASQGLHVYNVFWIFPITFILSFGIIFGIGEARCMFG